MGGHLWRKALDPTGPAWGSTGPRALGAALLTAGIVALSGFRFISLIPRFEEQMVRPMPEHGVRLLLQEGEIGNGFNAYRFGGFLMFRLYPREVVFMDGRNDLYGSFREEVYNGILYTRAGWRESWAESVERHDLAWVLLDEKDPLAVELLRDPGWRRAPGASSPVVDGRSGEDGVILLVRNAQRRESSGR